jgi:hypothetical protein
VLRIRDEGYSAFLTLGTGINILNHNSESLVTIFGLKILQYNFADPDPGLFDPGSGMEKIESGINILDPQHWQFHT